MGAWQAGARQGEGGWGGEEGEARGCQNQLRAVQTPGQLRGVARETRHSWSTTGSCLPRKLLMGLPTAQRAAGGAAAHRPLPQYQHGVTHSQLIHGCPIPLPALVWHTSPRSVTPLPGRALGQGGLASPGTRLVAGAGRRQQGVALLRRDSPLASPGLGHRQELGHPPGMAVPDTLLLANTFCKQRPCLAAWHLLALPAVPSSVTDLSPLLSPDVLAGQGSSGAEDRAGLGSV